MEEITGENSIREVYELVKKYVDEAPEPEPRPGRGANPFVRR